MQNYQIFSTESLPIRMPFTTMYMCESGFSSVLHLINKYQNRLNQGCRVGEKTSDSCSDLSKISDSNFDLSKISDSDS